jgi:branched-chain amino acid transport system substrate-binding protein
MKKNKVLCILLTMVLAMSLLGVGCTGGGNEDETPDNDTKNDTPIKIGALTSLSGVLEDYGQQFKKGFELGLEYMTDGTMEVAGRTIEVIWEDTTTVPDVARERAIKLLDQDKVDILAGITSSSDALAVLPIAEEFETILVAEPAAADVITGEYWNRYVFRTGRNTAQDAIAMADIVASQGTKIATLAPDTAFGHAGVGPFVAEAEARGADLVAQEFPPADATDFTSYILRIMEAEPEYLFVVWAGANNPWRQLSEMDIQGAGITISTGAAELAALRMMNDVVGMHGFTLYYHSVPPNNPMNDWLNEQHQTRFGSPPDIFTSGGMAAASAIITALEITEGDTDTEKLIATMRGMEFDSPTGKRWFRSEDHQAMQPLFEIVLEEVAGVDHPVPKLIRVIPAETLAPPIKVPAGATR